MILFARNIFKKYKISFVYLLILTLFFLLQYTFLYQRNQSFHFSDENEHITPAWEIITQGKILYKDLITLHQPLPIFTAYIFWKIFPFSNLFMLIERVRQFIFILSFFGALILTCRFGWKGLFSVIVIETIKFYLFGYHLLSESLVVYPLMYLAGFIYEYNFEIFPRQIFFTKELFLIGFVLFLIGFNLLPTWPFILLVIITLLYVFQNKYHKGLIVLSLFSGLLIPVGALFSQISFFDWFKQTIIYNYKYFLPYDSAFSFAHIFNIIFYPFLSLFYLNQSIGRYYFILLVLFILNSFVLIYLSKTKKVIFLRILVFYILIILLNLRINTLNVSFYSGFHILPQIAFYTMIVASLSFSLLIKSQKIKQRTYILAINIFLFLLLIVNSTGWWNESGSINKIDEHFIQYGGEESIGMALSVIKNDKDTLLAGPQASYINILSGLPLATGQTAYLAWSYRSPELKTKFDLVINENPPTFIYFPESDNPYFQYLSPKLKNLYARVKRKNGDQTDLYILASSLLKINSNQWRQFDGLFYMIPSY